MQAHVTITQPPYSRINFVFIALEQFIRRRFKHLLAVPFPVRFQNSSSCLSSTSAMLQRNSCHGEPYSSSLSLTMNCIALNAFLPIVPIMEVHHFSHLSLYTICFFLRLSSGSAVPSLGGSRGRPTLEAGFLALVALTTAGAPATVRPPFPLGLRTGAFSPRPCLRREMSGAVTSILLTGDTTQIDKC